MTKSYQAKALTKLCQASEKAAFCSFRAKKAPITGRMKRFDDGCKNAVKALQPFCKLQQVYLILPARSAPALYRFGFLGHR